MDLTNAVVYDIETFPNVFTLHVEGLHSDVASTWEISDFRDDRAALMQWFNHMQRTKTPMIGFFSMKFDYPVLHWLYHNPQATVAQIYEKSRELSKTFDGWTNVIWDRDMFAPQIDLFMIHHFDNKQKRTDLKSLQINMRSPSVVESRLPFGVPVAAPDVDAELIPYNKHDVAETKRFAHYSLPAINFRIGLIEQFGVAVMNYNDTKIGEKMLEQRLGENVCFDRSSGRKQKRQTPRSRIRLADVIFPYIQFNNPEFQRVLDYMKAQTLTPDDLDDPDAPIKTKGVFSGLAANVGGVSFEFGTGGIHASVTQSRFQAGRGWLIRDIDVASLYPSIAIVNRLAPAHLGDAFVAAYASLPAERKEWQKKKGKKCVEANSIKLAGNGAYGKSNSKFSVLYDPQFTMTITINGQLMLCMLAERLVEVPTLQIIQVNTDGITYYIHERYEAQAAEICQWWQDYTKLTLEDVNYNRMWIADVNTYLAEPTVPFGQNEPPVLKQKGRLWHPDPFNYAESISECQPPAWHKDLGNVVSIRAAIAAMTMGIDPETFIRAHSDPFDFMCRIKVDKASQLILGGKPIQRTTRYYVVRDGQVMTKVSPPAGPIGAFKRANGVTDAEYRRVMDSIGWQWDARVCSKNKSVYEDRTTGIEAGWLVAECNDASTFRFDRVNYAYYVAEARKLIIA